MVVVFLLAALTIAVRVDYGCLVHDHSGADTAVYNANCPLAAVAACHGVGVFGGAISSTPPLLAADVAPRGRATPPSAPPLYHADPRAPPSASRTSS